MNEILIFLTSPLGLVLLYVVASVGVVFGLVFLIRWYIKDHLQKPESFRRAVLMITVPKEDLKSQQSQELETYEKIQQQISVSEAFYATIGGLKAQTGWQAFWYGRNDHVSLEIVADKEKLVTFYATVPRYMQRYLEQQVHAQFDAAQIEEIDDYNIFDPQGVVLTSTLTLKKKYLFPILTYDKMEADPLNALTNVLSKFEKEEGACIQFVIRSAKPAWHRLPAKVASTMQQGKRLNQAMKEVTGNPITKALRYISKNVFQRYKKEEQGIDVRTDKDYRLSPMEEEIVKSLEDKTSHAGFDVNIRVVVSGKTKEVASYKLQNILTAFTQYSGYQYGNAFVASKPAEKSQVVEDYIYRHFDEKKSFVLNTKEMASLYHFPLPTTETPNIRWLVAKKAPPPFNLPKDGVILGELKYRGIESKIRIKKEDRMRHMYVIGKSGSGKSVMLSHMAIQDIQNGDGVGIIDPHGDLVEDILPHIPKERADDVIIFHPSDTERPMGLNMLEYDDIEQKDFAVQEMVAIFYKLFGEEMIGPMFEHYMRNAMLALMDDEESGATLIEIPRMFTDTKFRKDKLKNVTNPIVKNFWEQEYEQSQAGQQAADMLSYVISKIGRFLTNDMMRNIVGQAQSGFNITKAMNEGKIVLVNLSKGTTGEVNSSLLGLIIVSKFQMAAMTRAKMRKEDRKDFFLYIDEFQNYCTDSIATILSEARKYRLSLNLAHQYIGQLVKDNDTSIKDAVFGNAGTLVSFRVGVEDAEVMSKEFAPVFDENDVINVEKFTANIKLLIDNTASRPFNMKTIMPSKGDLTMAEDLKQLSRLKYGRDRAIVEAEIRERGQLDKMGAAMPSGPDSFM